MHHPRGAGAGRTRRRTDRDAAGHGGQRRLRGVGRRERLPVRSILRIEHLSGRADRTLTRPGGVRIEHLHPAPRPRIEHLRGRRGLGSNRSVLLHATDRTLAQAPRPRIEHLRRRSIPRIETLRSRRTRRSTPFRPAQTGGSNSCRTRGSNTYAAGRSADRTLAPRSTPARIEHLPGRRARGSNRSGLLDPADRHPSESPDARIDTLPVRAIPRIEQLPDARIEHLRGPLGRGSNRSGLLDPVDRDPSESPDTRIDTFPARSAPWIDTLRGRRARGSTPFRSARSCGSNTCRTRGSNTCAISGGSDRTDPVCSIPRIETLRSRRTRGSTPFRPDPCHGSTPFAGAGRTDRHPSGPLDPADRTLAGRADRTLTRRGGVRIEHLLPAPDPRGSNTCAVAGGSDRTDPVCSMSWIEHLRSRRRRGSRPFQFAPRRGSTPFAVVGAQIDTLPRRRIDTLRGHRIAPIDTLFARSIPWIEILRGRRGADRRPSRSPAGANPGGRPAGLAVSTGRPAALRLPPGSTAPESRNTK